MKWKHFFTNQEFLEEWGDWDKDKIVHKGDGPPELKDEYEFNGKKYEFGYPTSYEWKGTRTIVIVVRLLFFIGILHVFNII